MDVLVGDSSMRPARIIQGKSDKTIRLDSILPKSIERFAWAGHLGISMADDVIHRIEQAKTTLVFANTRNQVELWYQELLRKRPDWAGLIALHHGSLSREVRTWVENALRDEKLKAVVCTSSLDLGVDFAACDQVVQVGSPKGLLASCNVRDEVGTNQTQRADSFLLPLTHSNS